MKILSHNPFLKSNFYRLIWLLAGFLVLKGILIPFFVFGAENAPFVDNFDIYNAGEPLNNQGNWSASNEIWVIDGDFCKKGKCVKAMLNYSNAMNKSGVAVEKGAWVWYGKLGNLERENLPFETRMISDDGKWIFRLLFYYWTDRPNFTNKIVLTNGPNIDNWVILVDEPIPDAWYRFWCEWDLSSTNPDDRKIRCKVNNRLFTDWLEPYDKTGTNIQKFIQDLYVENDGIDEIGEKPSCNLENCGLCETYETCIGAGCYWYYEIYLQKWYCVPPYEAPEECGAFYKCQYCLTKETCETQLNCEWVDRGLGEKCYMREPKIPPEQVEWRVPELEVCDELSGVEKWLCEIKNFIAGIFKPSQDKIDKLYQTIANFKEKFPFNYLGALQVFFDDIRKSLDTPKDIPIKILGIENKVDFSFWEKETKIGGMTEKLKNVLFDFSTILILIVFLVWLISFIRRIF
jgi:hypothetical protein